MPRQARRSFSASVLDFIRPLTAVSPSSFSSIQSLYEKRLATYPRTDSRYLTEDMAEGLPALCSTEAGAFSVPFQPADATVRPLVIKEAPPQSNVTAVSA